MISKCGATYRIAWQLRVRGGEAALAPGRCTVLRHQLGRHSRWLRSFRLRQEVVRSAWTEAKHDPTMASAYSFTYPVEGRTAENAPNKTGGAVMPRAGTC